MTSHKQRPAGKNRARAMMREQALDVMYDETESLALEFDPFLFSLDPMLCKTISSFVHHYNGEKKRPFAVVATPPDAISWQVGFLAKWFDLCLWSAESDDAATELASRYGASSFTGAVPDSLSGMVDLFLFIDSYWAAEQEFVSGIAEAREHTADDGEVAAVLRCSGDGENSIIVWADGSETLWKNIVQGRVFRLPAPDRAELTALSSVTRAADFGLKDFLSRHKSFFGKDARDFCLMQTGATDFMKAVRPPAGDSRFSALTVWKTGEGRR